MNIQQVSVGSEEFMWNDNYSMREVMNEWPRNRAYETDQTVKIEYVNEYEQETTAIPTAGVIVEKVDAPVRKPNNSNLNDFNGNSRQHQYNEGYGRTTDISGGKPSFGNQGVTSLIEKFESKMMQNISTTYTEVLNETSKGMNRIQTLAKDNAEYQEDCFRANVSSLENQDVPSLIENFETIMKQNISTTYTEVLNEISKSMNRIVVLAQDNAEYQEDCLRANVSEISRFLKIFPKRPQSLQIDKDNIADKSDVNHPIIDEEERPKQKENDKFFSVLEKDLKIDVVASPIIKEEPYEQYSSISEAADVEEYLPIFRDTIDDGFETHDIKASTNIKEEEYGHQYSSISEAPDVEEYLPVFKDPIDDGSVKHDIKEEHKQNNDTAKKDWICTVCKYNFSSKCALKRHQKRNITCSAAILLSKDKEEKTTKGKKLPLPKQFLYKSHTKISPDVPYKPCFFCPHAFQRITELIGHLQVAHPNEDLDHLANILPSLHIEDLKPEIIKKCLKDQTHVKDEGPNEFNGSLSTCSFCPSEFASFSRLLSHVRFVHPDCDKNQGHWTLKIFFALEQKFPSKLVNCEECGKEIKLENLYKHMSNHNQKLKDCPDCGKSVQSNTYSMHIKTHIEQDWLCNECGLSFKTQKTYKKHILSHDPNFKGFPCTLPDCNKIFDNRSSLTIHTRLVHEKTKRFMCQFCSYAAGISGNLAFHIRRVHSKERPSQCPECDYKTIGSQELKRHVVAVHRRDEHFQCQVCQWTTPRKNIFVMHNRLNCRKPPFTDEDRARSKAILAAEKLAAGEANHIYSY